MKKFALTALAAAMVTIGLASAATADSRYGDDEDQWRRHSQDDRGDWDGRRDGDRDGRREDDRQGWRDHDRRGDDEWRWGHRRDDWRRYHHRYGWRPQFRDEVCFVKKIRRYDDWGNAYVKRVRICR